jgi:hypothetical protein
VETKKKDIIIENLSPFGEIQVLIIVEYSCECLQSKKSIDCYGSKRPLYIILINTASKRIFRAEGEEITFEQLLKECPNLQDELERI